MDTIQICQQCQKPLPPNAPEGLCPECLARVALGSEPAVPGATINVSPLVETPPGDHVPPAPAALAAQFPQLEILELLGVGGMGMVYKARQPRLDRLVALKILPIASMPDASFVERFEREAKALARLNHPGIVTLYDFGQTSEYYYFIMEFVDGMNLRQLIQAKTLDPRQALELVMQICTALQFAHDEKIVHRDIKPENILITKKGQVKIADFGLAKLLGGQPDTSLTASQMVMGTVNYMAPEQRQNTKDVDHRADIYSLGVVFYEMLTGEVPMGRFDAPSKKVQIDVRLDEVVLHALEREPARRYQKVSEVKSNVEAIASTTPAPTPPPAAPAPDASSRAVPRFSYQRTYWIFFVGWLVTKLLWNFRAPGCWLAVFGMATLTTWVSLKRMRLFPDQVAAYFKLAPAVKLGALIGNFIGLILGLILLMSTLFSFWEQDPLHGDFVSKTAAQYEAEYKGKEYHLLQGMTAFSQSIPDVEFVDRSVWDSNNFGFLGLWPQKPAHSGFMVVVRFVWFIIGCFSVLLVPCDLIGEWHKYKPGLNLASVLSLFSISLSIRHVRAGLAVGACLLGSFLPLYLFTDVTAGAVCTARSFFCNTNMAAVNEVIENWATHDHYAVGDVLHWNLDTVPNGKQVAEVWVRQAWKASAFDRWHATLFSFHRTTPRLGFEIVSSVDPAQTRLTVSSTGTSDQLFPKDLATALEQLEKQESALTQPLHDANIHTNMVH
jgi:predicted Ser/Thr protein kinase